MRFLEKIRTPKVKGVSATSHVDSTTGERRGIEDCSFFSADLLDIIGVWRTKFVVGRLPFRKRWEDTLRPCLDVKGEGNIWITG
ncbi:hypothetical protein R1flu_025552 [Riccia fluitans]|uniref:Uncharacterized protein n=1 Tax=Riccia fluitans TaxID=41844 RepID=A0ABD1XY24_9MARC